MRVWQRFAANPAANSDLQLRKDLEMATLRLSAEHQEQLNNLQKSQRPRLVKGRKNLGLVIAVLNEFIAAGKPETTSRDVADALVELGLDTYWDRNPDAKDDTGLVKSVGDCLGNHRDALRLERVRVDKLPGVRLPSTLIDDQWLRDKGIDPDTCRHEAVVVQLAAGEPDPATEPTDTEPTDTEPEPEPVPDDVLDAMLDQLDGPESDDLDPTLDATMNQLDDPELDADYYRD
jgi:hypothetical protein